jgi:hypothetical protein
MSAPEFPGYFEVILNTDVIHSLGGANKDETVLLRSIVGYEKVQQ